MLFQQLNFCGEVEATNQSALTKLQSASGYLF